MTKKLLYIIGSPYTGSTLISEEMSRYESVSSIGEPNRYIGFGFYPENPSHYLKLCSYCSTHEEYNCPVWPKTEDADQLTYQALLERVCSDVIIDSSKEADWFLSTANKVEGFEIYILLLVRNPVSFVSSNIKRRSDLSVFSHAEGWRNIYEHAFRSVVGSKYPFLIVRYEDFIIDNNAVLNRIFSFLSHPIREKKLVSSSHPLGGNLVHLATREQFDLDRIHDTDHGRDITLIQSSNFNKAEQKRIYKRKIENLTNKNLHTIMSVPNLIYISSFLGYSVSDIVQALD